MTIKELIDAGKEAISASLIPEDDHFFCSGESFREWLALSTRFLEQNYPEEEDTERFVQLAKIADKKTADYAERLIGILKAIDAIPPKPKETPIVEIITNICNNFNRFELSFRRRHAGRTAFVINDEYDVQDALRSILALFIKDIRVEDYVPSYAGGKSRVDFHLPEHGIIIETKMASEVLRDREIGDQLIIDFQHYKQMPNCNHLICFVYDKNCNISNPYGLVSDLENQSDTEMIMTVIISPMI